ncbi:MAG TPA: acyl-CoA desaturase [Bryobacteraceae bacterium]|nr:acyl-CoA desaturase [Bryobacteraceae bacterium]
MSPAVRRTVPVEAVDGFDLSVLGTWGMILLHASCLLAFATGVSRAAALACGIVYCSRILGITLGYHRCLAHRTFQTSRPVQFILAWLGTSAMQRGPLWFVALHRAHHRHADTELDVHSPVARSFWWGHIGWILCRRFDDADLGLVRDLSAYPELRWLDRAFLVPPVVTVVVCAVAGYLLPGASVLQMLVWGFAISTVLSYHATFAVNSLAHRYGSRPFRTKDNSHNNWLVAAIMMGEGFHNNHHRFPASARFGLERWQIDIGYCVLCLLAKLGLVWDIRIVRPARLPVMSATTTAVSATAATMAAASAE